MNLFEFAELIGTTITITRYPQQENRISIQFERVDIKQGGLLCGEYGNANDSDPVAGIIAAINDYSRKLSGQHIVLDAYRDTCIEYHVPTLTPIQKEAGNG